MSGRGVIGAITDAQGTVTSTSSPKTRIRKRAIVENPHTRARDRLRLSRLAEDQNVGQIVPVIGALPGKRGRDHTRHPSRMYYRFAKMLISGQFTMNPVDWNVLLAAPDGVML